MEKHIYFVRHGESESNADHVHRGTNSKLTERGRAQAEEVAQRIEKVGADALLSSTFERAVETADIIGQHIGREGEQSALLGEWLEPSHLRGLHRDDPAAVEVRELINEMVHDDHFRAHDEETFAELLERGRRALQFLEEYPGERICVVTHGGFLRVLVGIILFRDDFTKSLFRHLRFHFKTTNTGITYVGYHKTTGWGLLTLNDQSHLG